jgi:hypothetical protein
MTSVLHHRRRYTGPPFLSGTVPSCLPSAFRHVHWLWCSCVWVRLQPVCLVVPGTDLRYHPVVRAAATHFMYVVLGRSTPVLHAGVRWAKLELAWRFGSLGRQATWVRCGESRKQSAVLHSWRRHGGGWGGREGARRRRLTDFDPPDCYLLTLGNRRQVKRRVRTHARTPPPPAPPAPLR